METDPNKAVSGKRYTLLILLIFLSAFMICYGVMLMLGPGRKLKEVRKEFTIVQTGNNKVDERVFSDSAWLSLHKEKTFLQSKTAMAETDSIYLIINLSDSTANLEISGVTVHSSRVKKIRVSKMFSKGDEYTILSMLSSPLTVTKDYASIKKEPLMIKMAPKDTSEYKPDILPDTSDYEPVNYILETNKGIKIYVYQEEKTEFSDRVNLFGFDLNDRIRNTIQAFKSMIRFDIPEYHPYIKLILPKAEAKTLYRAIPRKGQAAVYL